MYDPQGRTQQRKLWPWIFASIILIVVFLGLFIPTLDVNRRQLGNEAATASRLRRLNEMQILYAQSHPMKGFACQLSDLKPAIVSGNSYDPNEFLLNGVQSGYRFVLVSCQKNQNGIVTEYRVTAVPLEQNVTGFAALCTDHTGTIFIDRKGSAERCLTLHQPLE